MNKVLFYFLIIVVNFVSLSLSQNLNYNPDIKILTTSELTQQIEDILLVDSRDPDQYESMHIKNAVSLPVYKMTKENTLGLIEKNNKKIIVFYCNINCGMSFDAAIKAMDYKVKNVFVYKEGLQTFAKIHPDLISYRQTLISREQSNLLKYSKYFIDTQNFISKIKQGYILIDIRDDKFKQSVSIKFNDIINLTYQELIDNLSKQDNHILPTKRFLIIDDFGNLSETLIPYLAKSDKTDYFLLDGGMRKWLLDGYNTYGNIENINISR